MILTGAGGHALEVFDLLRQQDLPGELEIYDGDTAKLQFKSSYPIHHDAQLLQSKRFCLGVGTPKSRKSLYDLFTQLGIQHFSLRGNHSEISPDAMLDQVDVFHHCFIGPAVSIGKGSLVNTRASVHHEAQVGEFTVINPGALLLGAVEVGDFCSIGAHATILPGVKIGNHVTIGAGSVIIHDVADGLTMVGVPGRQISGQ